MGPDLAARRALEEPRAAALSGGSARWIGAAGIAYHAEIFPLGLAVPARPGVFILAKPRTPLAQSWTALYVGADADVAAALDRARHQSPLWNFAVERGMTAIHLVTAGAGAYALDVSARDAAVRDLVVSLLPSLNHESVSMQRPGASAGLGVTT
ncbi:MAG: hypothetical protein KIT16_18455 [Rhodospirillaceae bacterium]|nr:hypothetical protein [Rhodospirillaceae bacterium]